MKRTCSVLAAVLALVAVPAAASAATVTKSGSTITYVADPGESNDVTISSSGDTYTVTDQGKGGVAVNNGGGCQVASAGTATCPASGVKLLDVETGDRDDSVKILAATSSKILGGDGSDILVGGPAGDTFIGGPGADSITGGGGNDVADYSDRTAPLTITLDGKPDDGEAGEGDNVAADIDIVNGGSGSDQITGSDGDNVLNGNGGNDTLNGAGGDDALNRGDGDADPNPGAGDDVLKGGPGLDGVSYQSEDVPVTVSLDGTAGDGAAGENDNVGTDVENITGGNRDDILIGNAAANVIQGGPGNDRMLGGAGPDTLDGGPGNDSLQALDGSVDQLLCDGGADGVVADKRDVLNACEVKEPLLVQVLVAKAKVRSGVVRIPLRCSAYAADGCAGSLTLKYGRTSLGKKSFDLQSGSKKTLKFKLSKRARKLVRKKHGLRVSAGVHVKDPSGQTTRSAKKVKLTS